MTKEEIISAFKFIESKCDKIINNKNYVADDFVQDTVEDISEMCNRILDGQFGDILETKPDISSNLDEAAIKYGHDEPILPEGYNDGDIPLYERWTADAFKAGAEWMAKQNTQPEVDLVEEFADFLEKENAYVDDNNVISYYNGGLFNHTCDIYPIAKHFYELGLNARKEG